MSVAEPPDRKKGQFTLAKRVSVIIPKHNNDVLVSCLEHYWWDCMIPYITFEVIISASREDLHTAEFRKKSYVRTSNEGLKDRDHDLITNVPHQYKNVYLNFLLSLISQ